MSTPVEDLARSLKEVGNAEFMNFVAKLALLTPEQKQAVTHFVEKSTPADVNEAASVSSMLKQGSGEYASSLYEENSPALRFLAFLRGKPSVVLRDDDLRVELLNPETDIEVESSGKVYTGDKHYTMFLVTTTVTGHGSKMSFKAHVYFNDHTEKDDTFWLKEVVNQCKSHYTKKPVFSMGTRLLGGQDKIKDFIANPSKAKYEGVKNYFILLEKFLGDFKTDPTSYSSRQVQDVVYCLMSEITRLCDTKQHISYELGEYLIELSSILGYMAESECIILKNASDKNESRTTVVLVKSPHSGWVLGSRTHPGYQRLLLAEKLTN